MKKTKVNTDEVDGVHVSDSCTKIATHVNIMKNFVDNNVISYIAHTGFVGTSFDKYPEWLQIWSVQNYFKFENGRLCLMNKTSNSVRHEFSIGDPVIFFEKDNVVECGARALIKLITGFNYN